MTVTRVLDNLKDHNFEGEFVFAGFGEPLFDREYLLWAIGEIRKRFATNGILIFTNGDLVPKDQLILEKLAQAGVNEVHHTRHDPPWRPTEDSRIGNMLFRKQSLSALFNRMGRIELPGLVYKSFKKCKKQYVAMISANGLVGRCCEDFNSENPIGKIDLNDPRQLLVEKWRHPWNKIRRGLIALGFMLGACSKCKVALLDVPPNET